MGASKEIIKPLGVPSDAFQSGGWFREQEVGRVFPDFMPKWYAWLDAQRDPGLYESYKVIRDGEVVWVTDTFMPPSLCAALHQLILDEFVKQSNVGLDNSGSTEPAPSAPVPSASPECKSSTPDESNRE